MTPLFKKLNYKGQEQILVVNAPESFKKELDALAQSTDVTIYSDSTDPEEVTFAICFVKTQAEIDRFISAVEKKLPGDVPI